MNRATLFSADPGSVDPVVLSAASTETWQSTTALSWDEAPAVTAGAAGNEDDPDDAASPATDPIVMSRRQALQSATLVGAAVATVHMRSFAEDGAAGMSTSADLTRMRSAAEPTPQISPVRLQINGREYDLKLDTRTTLLDTLREHLDLTGSKKGCDHGQCGACTVLIDGRRAYACLSLAVMLDGHEITTIEGLSKGEQLHPMQQAFLSHDGFQCGYCTPGQICSSVGMLNEARASKHPLWSVLQSHGFAKFLPSEKNPLPSPLRTEMVRESFPKISVLELSDHPSNEIWSKCLDTIFATNFLTRQSDSTHHATAFSPTIRGHCRS